VKVLLVNTNRETRPTPAVPIGIAAVARAAREAGHEVSLLDLCFARDPARALTGRLAAEDPDVVGVNVRNIDNCDARRPVFYGREIREWVRIVRERSRATIVLGGSGVSILPEAFLRYLDVPIAAVGEGERSFTRLLARLDSREDHFEVPEIAYLEGGAFRFNPPERREAPLAPAAGRLWEWIDLRAYARFDAPYPVQTKRGCYHDCVYCTYVVVEGKKNRFRSGEDVADEIREVLARVRPRAIEFVDSTFNSPAKHAIDVCRAIQRLPRRPVLQTLSLYPGTVTEELAVEMRGAGFTSTGITPESASDAVLSRMKKGFTQADVLRAMRALRKARIPALWIFLFGGPGETRETARETLRFLEENAGPTDFVFFADGIRVYPGTEMHRIAREEGAVGPDEDLLEPRYYFSPALDRRELEELLDASARRHPRFIYMTDIAERWVPALNRALTLFRAPGPAWRYAGTLSRIARVLPLRTTPARRPGAGSSAAGGPASGRSAAGG
jgi:radical SAM superfamily enzyme YgiQ (UPF0313 family)